MTSRAKQHENTSNEWYTPPEILNPIVECMIRDYGAYLDPYYSDEYKASGLAPEGVVFAPLTERLDLPVWANPPYGRGIGEHVKSLFERAQQTEAPIVALLPANTDTAWFHDYLAYRMQFMRGGLFVRGRISFVDASGKPKPGNTTGSILATWNVILPQNPPPKGPHIYDVVKALAYTRGKP
jgi:hypothetical protein